MKAVKKRSGHASTRNVATAASKLSKVIPQREIVQHLQRVLAEVDRLPVLTGELGCQALDCFELVDKIRTRYREKARKLLLEQPGAIPNWHCNEVPMRTLDKDTLEVFDALARADKSLTAERFIDACSVSLTAIRKLFAELNPDMSPDELEHALNHALVDLISHDSIVRLSRSKDHQLNFNLISRESHER